MSYRLQRNQSLAVTVRRIACEQVDRALAEIADAHLPCDQALHQVRKRCKKVRALLRLFRPALGQTYAEENAFLRALAGSLGAARDLDTAATAYDQLMAECADTVDRRAFGSIENRLRRGRTQPTHGASVKRQLSHAAASLQAVRQRAADWTLATEGFPAIGDGFIQTYRQGRKAMRVAGAEPTTEHFHEWRRYAKYHWYHLRLLEPLCPRVMRVTRTQARALGDLLGLDHDLAVLAAMIDTHPASFGRPAVLAAFAVLLHKRRFQLRRRARRVGRRLYAPKPAVVLKRLATCYRKWEAGQDGPVSAA